MTKKIVWALALSTVLAATPAYATHLTVFATAVEDYDEGAGEEGPAPGVSAGRDVPANALGMPDGAFVSLGLDPTDVTGALVLSFGTLFDDEATVWEITSNCVPTAPDSNTCVHGEQAGVYTSLTDATWDGPADPDFQFQGVVHNVPAQTGETVPFIISGPFRYLALVDQSDGLGSRDGFDVDAVSVRAHHVPEPALLGLLGLGMVGMGRLSRARRRV